MKKKFFTSLLLSVTTYCSHAAVDVVGTRVVYEGSKREASLSVKLNKSDTPHLVQSWIEDNGNSSSKRMIVTPPLFRMEPGEEATLRIIRIDDAHLPQDKESVFWLNTKGIPALEKQSGNTLNIAINTRIKIFYRPEKLAGSTDESGKGLKWAQQHDLLQVTNSSARFVSFRRVQADSTDITKKIRMIAPGQTLTIPMKGVKKVAWSYINDYGGGSELQSYSF